MKLTRRGFTLVELMIVMAIIGILAAVLFPSVTKYLANGRDTNRVAGVNQIVTAVTSYMTAQQGGLPEGSGTTKSCVSQWALASYMPNFPKDPTSTKVHGSCDLPGVYGYGKWQNTGGTPMFAISALLEDGSGGTIGSGSMTNYQGNVTDSTIFESAATTLQKGKGAAYVRVQ
jgi:prepilin-type N-terminal cleavage/methylation domain-containing protein